MTIIIIYYGVILCYNNHNMLILFLHVNLITPDGYTESKLLSWVAIYYVCSYKFCVNIFVLSILFNGHKGTYIIATK